MVFSELRREVIVCSIDIGGIVDHHYLNFPFIANYSTLLYSLFLIPDLER
jgi:hypothetical protein